MRFALVLFHVLSLAAAVSSELYSALAGMETLLDTQKSIINTLELYISESEKRLEELESMKDEYDLLLNVSSGRFQDFISNPINAFVLLKKLSVDWDETKKSFHYLQGSDDGGIVYPDYEDLSGAAKALLRVQQTYDFDTTDLSRGKLDGAVDGLELSADDCFELGRHAFQAGHYDYAISWLEEARFKNKETDEHSEITKYITQSSVEEETNSLMLFTDSLIQLGNIMSHNANYGGDNLLESIESNSRFTSTTNMFDEAMYRRLCQARRDQPTLAPYPYLRCNLVSPHPYLVLQPVKEEELWKEPKVSIFHDVISHREIEIMKSLALPVLQRAEVAEYTGHMGHRVSDTRVTKIAWLRKEDHPLIPRMYRRIEDITGLTSESAEPFQMANYGLGGHFHLHMDVLPDSDKYFGPDMGNRIATWLIYLSDVDGGGATTFPRLNLTVWPKKGSALFWHNVKSSGVGDILTLHGACPVVVGSKWVSNVWFHERGQEFRLKCGLDPESSLQPAERFSNQ